MLNVKVLKKTLGFYISEGGDGYGKDVMVFNGGGCQPATGPEIKMFDLLTASYDALKAMEKATCTPEEYDHYPVVLGEAEALMQKALSKLEGTNE